MKLIETIPYYLVDVRFQDNEIQIYDKIAKRVIVSESYNNTIVALRKVQSQLYLVLNDKDEIVSKISIFLKLISKKSELQTEAGYILNLHMDSPSHGYYFGYYEMGEYKLTKEANLVKIRSYPVQNCTNGCVTKFKNVYFGSRENDKYFLVKLSWKANRDPIILWKKVIPSAIMAMEIIEDRLFIGLKNGFLQLWDIQKDECIKNIRLFLSTISVSTIRGENITLASRTGDVARLSKNGKIQWEAKLTDKEIVGIYENIEYILVVNRIGEQFHINSKSGKLLKHSFIDLKLGGNAGLSSSIIKYRDRFVITGYGGIWAFRHQNSNNSVHQYMDDPLMRIIHQHPFGFYSGDDNGSVCFWGLGDIKIEVKNFKPPLNNYEEYKELKLKSIGRPKRKKKRVGSYSKSYFESKSKRFPPKMLSKPPLHPPPPPIQPGDPTVAPQGRESNRDQIINSNFLNWDEISSIRWIYCQKCRRKFTKEEFFTHSCKIKPSSPRARRQRRPTVTVGDKIDPKLKGEVQSFLEWIKDSEGLSGYINYYLQQNNTSVISELSKIYAELRQILFESTQNKGEDRNEILSNLPIPSRSELLHEISLNIFEQNRIIKEHGVPEEIISDLKSKKKEISREELLIDNLISNIQKNPSKKVIYLRLFLDRFRDLSDQDKNVIIKSIEDEVDDNNDDDYYIPYPYIFTHPQPPDDFEPAPQSQIRTPSKENALEDEYYCQFCGLKLTKEEQLTHSCKKKPE